MRRKYEAFIDGKRLLIDVAPDRISLEKGELLYRVDRAEEVQPALEALVRTPEITGLVMVGDDVDQVWAWFRDGYRFVQAAGGCVTDEQGRLLMIERLGRWDLPKGKVDKGEAIDAAAVREVQEECGLAEVALGEPLFETWHTYARKGEQHLKRTNWFLMRASSTEILVPQHEEDITNVRWMNEEEVKRARESTYPSLRGVIDAWAEAVRRPA
jgi:8-oxo-dGTP pyrophosphatase MutT (NUDIX family)